MIEKREKEREVSERKRRRTVKVIKKKIMSTIRE